jgi:hypothetical protein
LPSNATRSLIAPKKAAGKSLGPSFALARLGVLQYRPTFPHLACAKQLVARGIMRSWQGARRPHVMSSRFEVTDLNRLNFCDFFCRNDQEPFPIFIFVLGLSNVSVPLQTDPTPVT